MMMMDYGYGGPQIDRPQVPAVPTVQAPEKTMRQVRRLDEGGLLPWQQKIFDLSSIYDPRIIYLIVDEPGGSGKSVFCKWMSFRGHAKRIPATLSSAEDMMACVLAMGPSKCFLIDFPRSIRKTNMASFWTGTQTRPCRLSRPCLLALNA